MSVETASNIGVYWLTAVSTLLIIFIVLKSKWYANLIRISLSSMIFGFAATGWYITARRNNWIDAGEAPYVSLGIFGVFALWLTVLLVLLVHYNWNLWSWSRTDE